MKTICKWQHTSCSFSSKHFNSAMKTLAIVFVVAVVVALCESKPFEEEECDKEKDEEFQTCGSACPDTCENYKDELRICTLQCVIGCGCPEGKVRRKDGYCVYTSEC